MATQATHYDMLGVSPGDDQATIAAAYRRRARVLHPDAGGDVESFKRLGEAYATLKAIGHKDQEPPRLPAARMRWLTVGAAALYIFLSLLCFVSGDRHPHYSGWLVAAGWAFMILAVRAIGGRRLPLESPVKGLVQGLIVVGVSGVVFVWRAAMTMGALFAVVALLAAAEWAWSRLSG